MNSGSQTHECTKRGCYFCYLTAEHEPRPVTIIKPVLASDYQSSEKWSDYELEYLFTDPNISYSELCKNLTMRNRGSIQTIKTKYAIQYGWKWNGVKWVRK